MFRAAAAQEMAGRRELLLARLHEQGALTLDLNPEALTSSVLNQYLTVMNGQWCRRGSPARGESTQILDS
jgi:hypothetical protein